MSASVVDSRPDRARFLGVVFAGGASTRMGGDKAVLPWPTEEGDRPLFARAAHLLGELCDRVEISVGPGAPRPAIEGERWPTFPDGIVDAGPLAGLLASLGRAVALGREGVLVLACDMPLVGAQDFEPLVDEIDRGAEAAIWTVPESAGDFGTKSWDQPLVGAYSIRGIPAVQAALDSGMRRMVAIEGLPAAGGCPLRLGRVQASQNSSHRLVNVNTPSDYDLARTAAAAARMAPDLCTGTPEGGTTP